MDPGDRVVADRAGGDRLLVWLVRRRCTDRAQSAWLRPVLGCGDRPPRVLISAVLAVLAVWFEFRMSDA